LYLAKGGVAVKFAGENIPGYCAVVTARYEKNGKWSNTTYELDLAPGVRALHLLSPMHGTWGDNFGSWGEVAEYLQLPIEIAQQIVRAEYLNTGERLDRLEEFSLAQEEQGTDTEVVIISFGSPNNRAIREGYWEKPKTGFSADGSKEVTVLPGQDEHGRPDWGKAVAIAPDGAKVISARHSPGSHGGYWTIEVVIPLA
jgi:hypothetical protein